MKPSDIANLASEQSFQPTLTGSDAPDFWHVSQAESGDILVTDEKTGEVLATYSPAENLALDLDLGEGDDVVTLDPALRAYLRIHGGNGNDRINAEKSLAWLELYGDDGNDTLTGGSAIDAASGREGNTQIIGGAGDDDLTGGCGADFLRGGDGADQIQAGGGTDVIYTDVADASVDAGQDEEPDVVVVEGNGDVRAVFSAGSADVVRGSNLAQVDQYLTDHPQLRVVDDTPETTAILKASLGVMLSTESGKGLLDSLVAALEQNGEFIQLCQTIGRGGRYHPDVAFGASGSVPNALSTGTCVFPYGDGIAYTAPEILYHEFVHAWQDLVSDESADGQTRFESREGDGIVEVDNNERQAAGLPWIGDQGDYHTGEDVPFTQNKFREELGLPRTSSYDYEKGDPIQ